VIAMSSIFISKGQSGLSPLCPNLFLFNQGE